MNVGVETSVSLDEIRREEKRTFVTEKSRGDSFADTITEQSLEKQIEMYYLIENFSVCVVMYCKL